MDKTTSVAPSGSCAGMLSQHYPSLLQDDPSYAARARAHADKSHELMSYLTDVRNVTQVESRFAWHGDLPR